MSDTLEQVQFGDPGEFTPPPQEQTDMHIAAAAGMVTELVAPFGTEFGVAASVEQRGTGVGLTKPKPNGTYDDVDTDT